MLPYFLRSGALRALLRALWAQVQAHSALPSQAPPRLLALRALEPVSPVRARQPLQEQAASPPVQALREPPSQQDLWVEERRQPSTLLEQAVLVVSLVLPQPAGL